MEKPIHRFNLSVSLHLWQRIQALARRNRRPITQEILLAIEEHLARAGDDAASSVAEKSSPE